MAKKRKSAKRRDWSKELFAKPGSKDDFFTLSPRAARIFGGGGKSKRSQRASLNISGLGSLDRDAPQISGSGRAYQGVPDLGARKRDKSKRGVPDIGGARAQRVSNTVPDIGGGGTPGKGVPSLGEPPRRGRRKERVPGIGAMGAGGGDAPSIGGGAAGVPDISGAAGAPEGGGGKRGRRSYGGRAMRSVAAYAGFQPLSDAETEELELFYSRAISAGFSMKMPERSRYRAQIMLGQISAFDLWKSDVGSEIERRYGKRGQDLDLPEKERPRRGFVEEPEEIKEEGVKPSTKNFFRRIIDRVRGQP